MATPANTESCKKFPHADSSLSEFCSVFDLVRHRLMSEAKRLISMQMLRFAEGNVLSLNFGASIDLRVVI